MIYSPLPGEYIGSAVRRGKELTGLKSNSTEYSIKTIIENRTQKIVFPSSFVEHGITEEVLNENTIYPLAKALGSIQTGTNYTPLKNWKICLQCIADDIEKYGAPYIHRRNVFSIISHCSLHATKLYKNCPSCFKLVSSHKISEFIKCRKRFSFDPPNPNSTNHSFSIFVSDLLNYNGEKICSKLVEWKVFEDLAITQYNGDYSDAFYNIIKDANKALETNTSSASLRGLTFNNRAILTFFAYKTSQKYLDAMTRIVKLSRK